MKTKPLPSQGGFLLIEAMIAILIFALGILGLVAMGGTALGAQSDARVRTEAASLASEISSHIALNVDRQPPTDIPGSLAPFVNLADEDQDCVFSGTPSADPAVVAWVNKVVNGGLSGLPGATAANQQIVVDPALNRVRVTLCWRAPGDNGFRRHTLVTYIQ